MRETKLQNPYMFLICRKFLLDFITTLRGLGHSLARMYFMSDSIVKQTQKAENSVKFD